ncbi:MAG: hypothetical protein M3011_01060, partial [Actinomycetota bacterium]|nr:hypothetical protein [Actinomycetota bacterium]
ETDVVATAPSGQLAYFFNPPGSPRWIGRVIPGVFGVNPAVVQRPNGETDVVATAPSGRLELATNQLGDPSWGSGLIPGASGTNPAALLRAASRAGTSAGDLDVIARGPHGQLEYLAQPSGTSTWAQQPITGASGIDPVAVQRAKGAATGETDVVAARSDGTLSFYSEAPGSSAWRGGPV